MQVRRQLSREDGSALLWAIVLMMLLVVFGSAVNLVGMQNNKQIKRQYDVIKAGYIAEAGVELAYQTLFKVNGGSRIIDVIDAYSLPRSHAETLVQGGQVVGNFDAKIDIDTKDGVDWVVITSVGSLPNSKIRVERVLKINRNNSEEIIRDERIY